MANVIIYTKNSSNIKYFIQDCVKVGSSYVGSNKKLHSINHDIFSVLWTEDTTSPLIVNKITGSPKIWNKKVSEIEPAREFNSVVVSNREDVNSVTKNRIKEKYSIEEEIKLQREKLLGIESDEWGSYISYVASVVNEGRKFKDEHFIEHTIDEEPVLDYDALYYPNLKKENS